MAEHTRSYSCPLCNSALSKEHYEKVLNIDRERSKQLSKSRSEIEQERRQLVRERQRIHEQAAAAASEARAKARQQSQILQEQLKRARQELAKKNRLASEERRRIAQQAADQAKARYDGDLHRARIALQREGERRDRETQAWKKKIEELQRRAESHDRLHFGPEGEEELERLLRQQFPHDDIQRRGRVGDVIHSVVDRGRVCGKIVYECKRTATWQGAFVKQLKRAMEAHDTRYGLLVSRVLPPKESGLCVTHGVVVTAPHVVHHVTAIMREMIIELSRAQLSEEGKAEKTEEVYRYLRSEEFKSALNVVESRTQELRQSLEREKSSHETWWNLRDQSYSAIARQTAAVTGRVQEILATRPVRRLAGVRRLRAQGSQKTADPSQSPYVADCVSISSSSPVPSAVKDEPKALYSSIASSRPTVLTGNNSTTRASQLQHAASAIDV